jgi:hypothetical protein
LRGKDLTKAGPIKVCDIPKKLQKCKKAYEIFYDEISERYIFEIIDVDSLFPLLIKVNSIEPRELVFTRSHKLHLKFNINNSEPAKRPAAKSSWLSSKQAEYAQFKGISAFLFY